MGNKVSKGEKGLRGPKGETGPRGPKGETGPPGPECKFVHYGLKIDRPLNSFSMNQQVKCLPDIEKIIKNIDERLTNIENNIYK